MNFSRYYRDAFDPNIIRINVEEAVLQKYFKEYNLYKEKTYKLFPYIY